MNSTILFMFTTCVQLSFSVNTVGEILNSISLSTENTTEKIRIINKFMNRKKISFELQYQIREYIKIYWSQQLQQENEEEEKLITSLSENLKNKLIHEANFSIIEKCDLFQQTFSIDTKQKLIKLFKTILITPEQTISCQLPQINETCLCFIDQGNLNICSNITDRSEGIKFSQGQFFGLEELLTGQQPQLQLQSQSFVKLLILTRTDFINTLRENPNDYESFCQIKDEILLHQRDSQTKCKSCNCIGHDIQNCPIVHYVIDKERVIKSYQFQSEQIRVSGLRNRNRIRNQFNALYDQWFLQEIASMMKNHEDLPIVQFYGIQYLDDSEIKSPQQQQQSQQQKIQSKDSIVTNERGSFCFVDQVVQNSISPSPPKTFDHSIFYSQNKVTRKTYPKQSIRIKNVGIKIKFQKIIKKVIKMQNFSKAFTKLNDIEFASKFNQNIKFIVDNYFKTNSLKDYLNKIEYENLYFLRKKCELISLSEFALSKKPFEIQKEYQIYQVYNNLSHVIKKTDQYLGQQKGKVFTIQETPKNDRLIQLNQEERKVVLKDSLIRYLSFPNIYFNKYYERNEPSETLQSMGQQQARALFKAYKKRQIMRQNAFLLPAIKKKEKGRGKSPLAVGMNVVVPEK